MALKLSKPAVTRTLHGLLLLLSLSISFLTYTRTLFAWHPIAMSLGYILFMAEGLLTAIAFRYSDAAAERVAGIQSHAMLQLRATVLISLGFAAIARNKAVLGKPHFRSLHARVGLATLVLSLLSPLLGALSFRKLGFIQRLPDRLQPMVKGFHRQLGAVTWYMSVVTIQLALPHKSVYKPVLTQLWQGGLAVAALLIFLLMIAPAPRRRLPREAADVLKGV